MKKVLSLILVMLMLLSLCACTQPEAETPSSSEADKIEVPPIVYGNWYSHPDIDAETLVVNADGTCTINGQKYNWVASSIEADKVVLIAGEGEDEYTLTFSQLTFPVPLLGVTGLGVFNQYKDLWKYVTEWVDPEAGNTFTLSFFELAQTDCKLTINGSDMTVEVMKDGAVTHTIKFSGQEAIVTDAAGNSTTYEPMN